MRHEDLQRSLRSASTMARTTLGTLKTTLVGRWSRVSPEERVRLRHHAVALAAVVAATLLTLGLGLRAAGPLFLADLVIAAAAWSGGRSAGAAAALAAVLTARVAAVPLGGVPIGPWITLMLIVKGLLVTVAVSSVAEEMREDERRVALLEADVERLQAERRQLRDDLRQVRESSSAAEEALRHDADEARRQLTTLQSVTDPQLNALDAVELVASLLERVREALGADGVALYHLTGLRGRVYSAASGIRPADTGKRRPLEMASYQNGRTALVHNDAARVTNTSLCHWPEDITSLTAVPIVHAGRLRVVLEVANRRARRSTEWELALIQVVAERAAGLLGEDSYTGAVA